MMVIASRRVPNTPARYTRSDVISMQPSRIRRLIGGTFGAAEWQVRFELQRFDRFGRVTGDAVLLLERAAKSGYASRHRDEIDNWGSTQTRCADGKVL